jgi:hypothetical protein
MRCSMTEFAEGAGAASKRWRILKRDGQRPSIDFISMSALPPKSDMCGAATDVRFGPKADISARSLSWPCFDVSRRDARRLSWGHAFNSAGRNDMERLIDIFCHAIRITDPLSIKIAVGVIGGGLPLIFIVAALTKLGELVARLRETTVPNTPAEIPVPDTPARSKGKASRRSRQR